MHALSLQLDGMDASMLYRFCQQCGKLEPLELFEGTKHSCRAALGRRRNTASGMHHRRVRHVDMSARLRLAQLPNVPPLSQQHRSMLDTACTSGSGLWGAHNPISSVPHTVHCVDPDVAAAELAEAWCSGCSMDATTTCTTSAAVDQSATLHDAASNGNGTFAENQERDAHCVSFAPACSGAGVAPRESAGATTTALEQQLERELERELLALIAAKPANKDGDCVQAVAGSVPGAATLPQLSPTTLPQLSPTTPGVADCVVAIHSRLRVLQQQFEELNNCIMGVRALQNACETRLG